MSQPPPADTTSFSDNESTQSSTVSRRDEDNYFSDYEALVPNITQLYPVVRLKRLCSSEIKEKVATIKREPIDVSPDDKTNKIIAREFQCTQCSKSFSAKGWLNRHINSEHTDSFICPACGKDLQNAVLLRAHRRAVSMCRPRHQCDHCPKSFRELWQLNGHIRMLHPVGAWPAYYFECDYCNKRWHTKLKLTAHMSRHTNVRPYQCDMCQRPFFAEFQLKSHRRTHTADRNHCCAICPKRYMSRDHLINHMRTHAADDSHTCVHCGKSFKMKKHLERHELLHTNKRADRFPCTECTKSFDFHSLLVTHMRQHTGERPFACTDCDARFADRCNLQKHFRIHTGVKPFKCTVCDRRFNQLSSLRGHKKSHVDYKPFECMLCAKRFIDDDDLTLHLRRIHGDTKMFKCAGCDKEFDKLSNMKSHRRLHFGNALHATERDYSLNKYSDDLLKQREMDRTKMATVTTASNETAAEIEQELTPLPLPVQQQVEETFLKQFVEAPPAAAAAAMYIYNQAMQHQDQQWFMGSSNYPPFQ